MMGKYTVFAGLFIIVIFFVGCASKTSRLEEDYGNSYKIAILSQTLNPEAEKNLEPVEGFDGKAANAVMERYQKGFEKTSTEPIYPLETITFK